MKSVWTMPKMQIQQFEVNESIAACYDVQCTLYQQKNNIDDNQVWQGKDPNYPSWEASKAAGIWHSSDACGIAGNQIWRDGKLYEVSNTYGELPCTNVQYNSETGIITWENSSGNKVWHHEGRMIFQDEKRPNHS